MRHGGGGDGIVASVVLAIQLGSCSGGEGVADAIVPLSLCQWWCC